MAQELLCYVHTQCVTLLFIYHYRSNEVFVKKRVEFIIYINESTKSEAV